MLRIHVEPGAAGDALAELPAWVRLHTGDVLDHDLFGAALLHEVVEAAERAGARWVELEVDHAGSVHQRMAGASSMTRRRCIVQVGRDLPADPPPPEFVTRAFRPAADMEPWLALNNRAFHWHPEQSDWTPETLTGRMAEDWFDPAGFLVHETDGRLDGFCWTKVHADEHPPVGEIYVIGVDPEAQGRGLGRSLVLAGLDHLAHHDLRRAMLWVESDNTNALALYRTLGFAEQRRHCWWRREFS